MARTKQTARRSTGPRLPSAYNETFFPNKSFLTLSSNSGILSSLVYQTMLRRFRTKQYRLKTIVKDRHSSTSSSHTITLCHLPAHVFNLVLVPMLSIKQSFALGRVNCILANNVCEKEFCISLMSRSVHKHPTMPTSLLEVRKSSLHGDGAYALEDIPIGTPLSIVSGEIQETTKLATFDDHAFLLPGVTSRSHSNWNAFDDQFKTRSAYALSPFLQKGTTAVSSKKGKKKTQKRPPIDPNNVIDNRCVTHYCNHSCSTMANAEVLPLQIGAPTKYATGVKDPNNDHFRNAISVPSCPYGHPMFFSRSSAMFLDNVSWFDEAALEDGDDKDCFKLPFGSRSESRLGEDEQAHDGPSSELVNIWNYWGEDSPRTWLGYVYRIAGGVFLAEHPAKDISTEAEKNIEFSQEEDDGMVSGRSQIVVLGTYATLHEAALAVEQCARTFHCVINAEHPRHKWYYLFTHPIAELGFDDWQHVWEEERFPAAGPRPLDLVQKHVISRSFVVDGVGTLMFKIVCNAGHQLLNIGTKNQWSKETQHYKDGSPVEREKVGYGWTCDGHDEAIGGCEFDQSNRSSDDIVRFRCDLCDFDYCRACVLRNVQNAKRAIDKNAEMLRPPSPMPTSRCTKCNDILPCSPRKEIGVHGWSCQDCPYKLCFHCMNDTHDYQVRNGGGNVFVLSTLQKEQHGSIESRDDVWNHLCRPLLESPRTPTLQSSEQARSNYILVLCAAKDIKKGSEVTISYTEFNQTSHAKVPNNTSQTCQIEDYSKTVCQCQIYQGAPHTMNGKKITAERDVVTAKLMFGLPEAKRRKVAVSTSTTGITTFTMVDSFAAMESMGNSIDLYQHTGSSSSSGSTSSSSSSSSSGSTSSSSSSSSESGFDF